jgi:lauroyl/myristoyl acyltransferase
VKTGRPGKKNVTRWKRFRYRLEWIGLVAAGWIIRNLPYDTLQPLASFLGSTVFTLDRRGRAVAMENLRVAFGNRFSPRERENLARESYKNFARTMLCMFWSLDGR